MSPKPSRPAGRRSSLSKLARALRRRPDPRVARSAAAGVEALEGRVMMSVAPWVNPPARVVGAPVVGGGGDTTPPTASIPANPSHGMAAVGDWGTGFSVFYADDTAIDPASFGDDDVIVTGPGGFQQVARFGRVEFQSGLNYQVEYVIDAPADTGFVAADAGSYTVAALGYSAQSNKGAVTDTSKNPVPVGTIGSFNLNVVAPPPPQDGQSPQAQLPPAEPPAGVGASDYAFNVQYTDNTAVAVGTLDNNDILVTGPNGFRQVAQLASPPGNDGPSVVVAYRVLAPNGAFAAADAGTYTVTMLQDANGSQRAGVADTQGASVPAGVVGTFDLAVVNPPPSDFAPPQAQVPPTQPPPPPTPTPDKYIFVVRYTDDVAVAVASIGDDDVFVTGPNGFQQAALLLGHSQQDAPDVIAQYTIAAPNGVFTAADEGTYTVNMFGRQPASEGGGVYDTSGKAVLEGPIGAFQLKLGGPTPTPTPTPTTPVQPQPTPQPTPGPKPTPSPNPQGEEHIRLTNVFYAPGRYPVGGAVAVRGTASNVGNAPAGSLDVEVRLSPTPVFGDDGDDIELGKMTIASSLPPGASIPARLAAAVIPAGTPAGNYYLGMRVAPTDEEGGDMGTTDPSQMDDDIFISPAANIVVVDNTPPPPPPPVGGLNPNFGTNGVVRRRTGLLTTTAIAAQPDGKTIAVGEADGAGGRDFAATRFNADGSIDTTFANGNAAFADFAGRRDIPSGVKIQPDGKVLIVGTSYDPANPDDADFVLARFNADGSPDTGFMRTLTNFSADPATELSADVAHDLTLLPDGRILVSGKSDAGDAGDDFALAQFLPDGRPDLAFGGGTGRVVTDVGGGDEAANAVALDPAKGKIVIAGSAQDPATGANVFALVRYNPDGSLDNGFGTAGKVLTAVKGEDDEAFGVAVGAKGQIVAVGGAFSTTGGVASSDFAVARYSNKGVIDRTFNGTGVVTTNFGQPAVANQVRISDTGALLVSGATVLSLANIDPTHLDVALASYTATGALDTTFGTGGKTVLNLGTASSTVGATLTLAQQALSVLSAQKAITTALGGKIIAIAANGTDTVAAQVVANGSDLTNGVTITLPPAAVGGAKGGAVVTITDAGNESAVGAVTITLYASLDQSADSGDVALATLSGRKIKLLPGVSKAFKAKFVLPKNLADGNYYVVAAVDAGTMEELSEANNTAASASAVTVTAPFADLSGPALATPTGVAAGTEVTIPVTVTNSGNIAAKGVVDVKVLAAASSTPADGDVTLATVQRLKVSLKPGTSRTFRVKALVPDTLAAGSYYLLAVLTPTLAAADTDTANDVLAGETQLTLS